MDYITKVKRLEYALLFILFAIACFSGRRIFYSPFQSDLRYSQNPIATIKKTTALVQSKNLTSFDWHVANPGEKLYESDQVFTHKGASTALKLEGNTSLVVPENTLLRLRKNDEIQLLKGQLQLNIENNRKMKIFLRDESYELQSSKGSLQVSGAGNNKKIYWLTGEGQISKQKKTIKLKANQYLEVSANELIAKNLPIQITAPAMGIKLWQNLDRAIQFKWKSSLKTPVLWQISRSAQFSSILSSKETINQTLSWRVPESGFYYWRIIQGNFTSPTYSFEVLPLHLPQLLTPADKKQISTTSPLFRWQHSMGEQYEFTLKAIDPKKDESIIANEILSRSFYLSKDLKPGLYSWEIKILSPAPLKNLSRQSVFIILPQKQFIAKMPLKLHYPPPQFKLVLFTSNGDFSNSSLKFQWQSDTNIPNLWQFFKEKKVIYEKRTMQANHNFSFDQSISPGEYLWRVAYSPFSGSIKAASKLRQLTIEHISFDPRQLDQGTRIELKQPDQKVDFEWNGGHKKPANYLFELSKDRSFKEQVVSMKVNKQTATVTFPKLGIFYWRAKIITNDGKAKYLPPKKIIVQPAPLPDRLELAPEIEVELKTRKPQSSIWNIWNQLFPSAWAEEIESFAELKWEKESLAKKYILEIYADPELTELILKKETTDAYYEWETSREQIVYWRVAFIDPWDRQAPFSNISKLKIKKPLFTAPQTPKMMGPAHNAFIKKETKQLDLKITSGANDQTTEYLISNDINFNHIISRGNINETGKQLPINSLGNHREVFWRLKTTLADGKTILSKKRRIIFEPRQTTNNPSPHLAPVTEMIKNPKLKIEPITKNIHRSPPKKAHRMSLSIAPTMVQYELASTNFLAEIKGVAINSLTLEGSLRLHKKWQIQTLINHQVGKVFEDQTYRTWLVKPSLLGRIFSTTGHLLWGKAGVNFENLSFYELPEFAILLNQFNQTSLSYHLGLTHLTRLATKIILENSIDYSLGDTKTWFLHSQMRYYSSKDIYYSSGIQLMQKTNEDGQYELSARELQVFFGLGLTF